MQNRITRAFSNLAKNIVKLFQAPVKRRKKKTQKKRSEVKERIHDLKMEGVKDNETLKKYNAFADIFEEKHGKSIYSKNLTDDEQEEANDIFNMFLEDKLSTPEGIEKEYKKLKRKDLVADASSIKEMAKRVDAVKNVEAADRVHTVLTSPTEKKIWTEVRNNPDKYNVAAMSKAIMNVTDKLEKLKPEARGTSGDRYSKVIEEYKRIMGELEDDAAD